MRCWYPITIDKPSQVRVHDFKFYDKYSGNSKTIHNDRGILLTQYKGKIIVPCGRCPACRRRKQNEWAYRILEEVKKTRNTFFVTLTYADENLVFSDSGIPTLDPDRIHKLTKDLRYRIGSYRYFLCGEYGDQFDRPHYHICLFVNSDESVEDLRKIFEKCWPEGFTKIDCGISASRAKYCAKYSMKQLNFDYQDVVPPFARMSRRPGIGKTFLDPKIMDRFRKLDLWTVYDYQGTPYPLPRYYRDTIFSYEDRERHSDFLQHILFLDEEFTISSSGFENDHDYYAYSADMMLNRERLFIKHLQREQYKFKYKPKQHEIKPRYRLDPWEFAYSEFDTESTRFVQTELFQTP